MGAISLSFKLCVKLYIYMCVCGFPGFLNRARPCLAMRDPRTIVTERESLRCVLVDLAAGPLGTPQLPVPHGTGVGEAKFNHTGPRSCRVFLGQSEVVLFRKLLVILSAS